MNQSLPKNKIFRLSFSKKRIDIIVLAFLLTVVISLGVVAVVYKLSSIWIPLRLVEAQTKNFGQAVKVVFESKIPLKAHLEYGTSDVYLNTTSESEGYETRHEIYVANILPGKRHFIRLVGYSENGKVYESKFFTVE